jgi:hypothetical protein
MMSTRSRPKTQFQIRLAGSLVAAALAACVSTDPGPGNGGTGGRSGVGGQVAGSGGAPGTGGQAVGVGGAVGTGGRAGTGGESTAGSGGGPGPGTGGVTGLGGRAGTGGGNDAGLGDRPNADGPTDAVVARDAATTSDGSYVRTGWTAVYSCTGGACPAQSAADTGDVVANAFDGNYQTRWSTGVYQSALNTMRRFPLYFTVDMKQVVNVSKITTHPGCKDAFDSPGTIDVLVSTDGTTFTSVLASPHTPAVPPNGEACPPRTNAVATDTITFTTVAARYIQLKGTQRTTSDRYWAIGEMNVFP